MPRRTSIAVALLLLTVSTAACGEREGARSGRRAQPGPTTHAPRGESNAAEAPPPDLGAVEPIGDALARDETVAACLARERAHLSASASEALADLGYDSFLEDVCTASRALSAKDARGCDGISVVALRTACVARVAVAGGDPDACPRQELGRDPLCVAFASGNETLCAAVPPNLTARCHAVLTNDRRICREASELHRAECEALVVRLGALVAPRRRASDAVAPTWNGEAAIVTPDGRRETPFALPAPDLAHGVVLRTTRCTTELVVGDARTPRPLHLGREAPTHLVTTFPAGKEAPFTLPFDRATRFHFDVRGEPMSNAFDTRGTVEMVALEPARGGRLELRLRALVPIGDDDLDVTMHLATFVRDLDPIDPECAKSPRPEGGSSSNSRRGASPRRTSRTRLRPP